MPDRSRPASRIEPGGARRQERERRASQARKRAQYQPPGRAASSLSRPPARSRQEETAAPRSQRPAARALAHAPPHARDVVEARFFPRQSLLWVCSRKGESKSFPSREQEILARKSTPAP